MHRNYARSGNNSLHPWRGGAGGGMSSCELSSRQLHLGWPRRDPSRVKLRLSHFRNNSRGLHWGSRREHLNCETRGERGWESRSQLALSVDQIRCFRADRSKGSAEPGPLDSLVHVFEIWRLRFDGDYQFRSTWRAGEWARGWRSYPRGGPGGSMAVTSAATR